MAHAFLSVRACLVAGIAALASVGGCAASSSSDLSRAATTTAFQSDRLSVVIDGQGPDVILIPGLSSSPLVWEDTVAHLSARHRVHRIHVGGFAGAPVGANASGPVAAPVAEEIARYIREQGLEQPAVVGHSMGGTIGMMLAARHPAAVGRLMVVDQIPFMGAAFGPPGTTAESIAPVADQIRDGMAASDDASWSAQAEASIVGMINTETLRAGPVQDARRSDRRAVTNSFHELVTTDLRPEIARITSPVEVLYVTFNDARMTPEITDMIYRASYANLPSARLTRIDDSAHFIMFDQRDRFLSELDRFLAD